MKNPIGKTMHFLVHNGFVITVGVMGFVHAILLLIMLASGVMPLVWFNILSVTVYAVCLILCRRGRIMPVYISILLEVTAYTIISTYYVGLRCGTYCFLFSIVPIIIYFGSFLFKGKTRWSVALMLALNFLIFAALYIIFSEVKPVYIVSPASRITLVLFSSFAMVFSTIFYNFLYIYLSEVEKTDLESRNRQLSADASEDALTGLLNRRGFLPVMERLMHEGIDPHFCIAFCDIDNFKIINDSFGHDAGDEVLTHITAIMKKEMPGCEICRWGGEEIVILMRDYDLTVAKEKLEYLRKSIESNPTAFYNKRIQTTVTIGLEENRKDYSEPDDIIKVADERMYYGKQHGKNRLVFES